MKKWGIFIANDGKPIDSGEFKYRSDWGRYQVAMDRTPSHYQIIDNIRGGNALVASSSRLDEVIKIIKHGLPYTPEVLSYFYIKSKDNDSVTLPAGRYSGGAYYFSGTAGGYVDAIYVAADRTNVYIKHSIQPTGGGPYTSDANKYILRVKLQILSNDSHVESWERF